MREIKFRAWDKKQERMIEEPYYFDIYHYSNKNRVNLMTYRYYEDWRALEDGRGYECELMQYTGLRDKNNKEIYEGDILYDNFIDNENEDYKEYKGEVVFIDGCFVVVWPDSISSDALSDHSKTMEVIGNIYENPELLKK